MRVRRWQDLLADITDQSSEPQDWSAVAGNRRDGLGEDLFIAHPQTGVFHLKTFAKNPYDVSGVGTRVARKIDDDLAPLFPNEEQADRFGIQRGPDDEDEAAERASELTAVLNAHKQAPTTSGDLFQDVMEALDSPAYGPIQFDHNDRPESLDTLTGTFEEAEDILSKELDELISDEGVDRGFY